MIFITLFCYQTRFYEYYAYGFNLYDTLKKKLNCNNVTRPCDIENAIKSDRSRVEIEFDSTNLSSLKSLSCYIFFLLSWTDLQAVIFYHLHKAHLNEIKAVNRGRWIKIIIYHKYQKIFKYNLTWNVLLIIVWLLNWFLNC